MDRELRERTIFPVLIPVAAIVVTEIVVFSMSRILLTSGKDLAVAIALGMALAILIGATMIANRPRISWRAIVGMLAFLGVLLVAAGAFAIQRGPSYPKEEAANLPTLYVSAKDIAFSTNELKLSPEGARIEFTNADTQPHNIAIFPSEEELSKPLFRGKIVEASAKATYAVGKMEPGTYYFHCDVHPQMSGKAVVA